MDYLLDLRRRVGAAIAATPAVAQVLDGRAEPAVYRRYLENVWHYAQHSATVIGLAGARCVATDPLLADYLFHHAREELGHERWALDDLGALGVAEAAVRASRPVPSCAAMIGYEYYVAGVAHPVGLFGWLYVLEAMGEDLGGRVAAALGKSLGRTGGTRFVAGHGEADKDHTADLTRQIREHVRPEDRAWVHQVADVVGDLYVRIFEEIGTDTIGRRAAAS